MDEQAVALLDRIRRFAIPEGPVECRGTWLRQEGEMSFAPDRPWLSFTAEQWFEGDGIDFRWRASVRMAPLVHARTCGLVRAGDRVLTARLFGVIPVANARGPETDTGEALRGGGVAVAFPRLPAAAVPHLDGIGGQQARRRVRRRQDQGDRRVRCRCGGRGL